MHGKESCEFAYGDVISFQQSGARDPARVLEDVLDDHVSVQAARDEYGVVIVERDNGSLDIDKQETRRLRAARRGAA